MRLSISQNVEPFLMVFVDRDSTYLPALKDACLSADFEWIQILFQLFT